MKNSKMNFFPIRIFVVKFVLCVLLFYKNGIRKILVRNPIEVRGEFFKVKVVIFLIFRSYIGKFTFSVAMHFGFVLILTEIFRKPLIIQKIIGEIHPRP